MALSIKNPKAERLARELAQRLGVSVTEAVRIALENEHKEEHVKAAAQRIDPRAD